MMTMYHTTPEQMGYHRANPYMHARSKPMTKAEKGGYLRTVWSVTAISILLTGPIGLMIVFPIALFVSLLAWAS
jgi:hypothetical protein